MTLQGVELAGQVAEGGGGVQLVGVLGGEAERLPLALPADEDRDAPSIGAGELNASVTDGGCRCTSWRAG